MRPRRNYRAPRRRDETLTDNEREYLMLGLTWDTGFDSPFKNRAECKKAWETNREYLLSLRDHEDGYGSGTRPWAWWIFDKGKRKKPEDFNDEFLFLYKNKLLEPGERKIYLHRYKYMIENKELKMPRGIVLPWEKSHAAS